MKPPRWLFLICVAVSIALALRHPDWEIWAVDASEEMLALARQHARAAGVGRGRRRFRRDKR